MSQSSSSPLSYVTLPDPQVGSPSRQSLPPAGSHSISLAGSPQPQSHPASASEAEVEGEESDRRTFTQTLTDGLAALTDLTLSNRSDLEEVKQLVYRRYAREDECKEKCKDQCKEMKNALAGIAEGLARTADAPESAATTDSREQANGLLQELRALRGERERMIVQYTEGIREMQDYQTDQIIRAIRRVREDKRSQPQPRTGQQGARTRTTNSRGGRM